MIENKNMELKFILVEPAVSGNIGSAARAIKTMGFRDLWLVKPCDHLDGEALKLAHGARDILESARVFPGFNVMVRELDLLVGTTARTRNIQGDYLQPGDLGRNIRAKGALSGKTGIAFGREESGLTNQEIAACHLVASIPMAASYPSLNLSQAVMIFAYELSFLKEQTTGDSPKNRDPDSFKRVLDRTREVLEATDLSRNPQIVSRIMQRLALLGEEDINLVHSVTTRLLDKLKDQGS